MRGRQPAAGRTPADVAEVHVTEALNAAHSEAAHDGPSQTGLSGPSCAASLGAARACGRAHRPRGPYYTNTLQLFRRGPRARCCRLRCLRTGPGGALCGRVLLLVPTKAGKTAMAAPNVTFRPISAFELQVAPETTTLQDVVARAEPQIRATVLHMFDSG